MRETKGGRKGGRRNLEGTDDERNEGRGKQAEKGEEERNEKRKRKKKGGDGWEEEGLRERVKREGIGIKRVKSKINNKRNKKKKK